MKMEGLCEAYHRRRRFSMLARTMSSSSSGWRQCSVTKTSRHTFMATSNAKNWYAQALFVLHEHYFANLGGDGKPANAIKQAFVSYDQWEAEFKRTGNALGGGSGWVIFAHNLHTGELHIYWSWDHMHNAPTGLPLLVLDMYEHAYHMDYGAAAAKYVDAFRQNAIWEEVNRRYMNAQKAVAALKT